jgi:Leucine-rich repeat (LRR) protein
MKNCKGLGHKSVTLKRKMSDLTFCDRGLSNFDADKIVTPSQRRVLKRIGLGGNKLSQLPLSLAEFISLRYVNIRSNQFCEFPEIVSFKY